MMKQPVHPGRIVRHDCIEAMGLSVTSAASVLGVSRPTLSKVINGRAAISPVMAIRLSKAFGSRPETWLRMQLAFDLAQARRLAERHSGEALPARRPESTPSPALTTGAQPC
ncbi:MAG TPA: HigA family addiction module antitoxin [Pirellulales bacterium]|nr:HigA family addiction module antitoxin [Pirellulales bacterium]